MAHAGGVNHIGCIYNKYWLSNSSGPDTMKEAKKSLLVPISRGRDWGLFSSRSLPKTPDPEVDEQVSCLLEMILGKKETISLLWDKGETHPTKHCGIVSACEADSFSQRSPVFSTPLHVLGQKPSSRFCSHACGLALSYGSHSLLHRQTQGSFLQNTTGVLVPPPRRAVCNTCVPVYSTWDREPATEHLARKAYAHSFPH